eukprot:2366107-Amphidinium_carterae.1
MDHNQGQGRMVGPVWAAEGTPKAMRPEKKGKDRARLGTSSAQSATAHSSRKHIHNAKGGECRRQAAR